MNSTTATPTVFPIWQQQGTRATFGVGGWQGEVSLEHPVQGVRITAVPGAATPVAKLLGIMHKKRGGTPSSLTDVYVRDADLVASYQDSAPQTTHAQIYRSVRTESILGHAALVLDLLLSIQTLGLDIQLTAGTCSRVASSRFWTSDRPDWSSPTADTVPIAAPVSLGERKALPCVLASLADPRHVSQELNCSYVECASASDVLDTRLQFANAVCEIDTLLLHETMEKGVIRRLRVRGVLIQAPASPALAAAVYGAFLSDPPRLTT